MEALEPFGSRVRGADMRLQDLDWAGIVETVLGRVLVPQLGRAPPPRPRRVPYEAELDFSKHVIANAPPSLAQARDYMERVTGFAVPEDRQQAFGAWVMDCLLTEANVRAGGRSTVQYLAVLNSIYRRVAMVAAGSTTKVSVRRHSFLKKRSSCSASSCERAVRSAARRPAREPLEVQRPAPAPAGG